MKKLIMILALLIAGCATPTVIPTATFNDKAAIGIQTITVASQAATSLLVAKKITVAQDQNIQASLNLIFQSIEIAKSLEASDPTNAAAQLTAALAQIAAIQTQTGAKP